MTKEIKIWGNRLEISKDSEFYMVNNAELHLFVHVDKLTFRQPNDKQSWLLMWHRDAYIGSLWISSDTDMKKVRKFLEETK